MQECTCPNALPTLKQGDACSIPVHLYFNGEEIGAETLVLLEEIEFALGDLDPVRLRASDAFNTAMGCFLLPVTQEQTILLEEGGTTLDVRVRFRGGNVLGVKRKGKMNVADATSEVVL